MHKVIFFVKFANRDQPERWSDDSFTAFWENLKEFMLRNNTGELEWIIRD
jgi:hypothetical protein